MTEEDKDIEQFLKKNALWVIMDPWYPHPFPKDLEKDPNINQELQRISDLILDFSYELTHIATSCPKKFNLNPKFSHFTWFDNNHEFTPLQLRQPPAEMLSYLEQHGIRDIVYMGFHHGRCIIFRDTGAEVFYKLKKYKIWLKRDLVGVLGYDNPEAMDNLSKTFMTFL